MASAAGPAQRAGPAGGARSRRRARPSVHSLESSDTVQSLDMRLEATPPPPGRGRRGRLTRPVCPGKRGRAGIEPETELEAEPEPAAKAEAEPGVCKNGIRAAVPGDAATGGAGNGVERGTASGVGGTASCAGSATQRCAISSSAPPSIASFELPSQILQRRCDWLVALLVPFLEPSSVAKIGELSTGCALALNSPSLQESYWRVQHERRGFPAPPADTPNPRKWSREFAFQTLVERNWLDGRCAIRWVEPGVVPHAVFVSAALCRERLLTDLECTGASGAALLIVAPPHAAGEIAGFYPPACHTVSLAAPHVLASAPNSPSRVLRPASSPSVLRLRDRPSPPPPLAAAPAPAPAATPIARNVARSNRSKEGVGSRSSDRRPRCGSGLAKLLSFEKQLLLFAGAVDGEDDEDADVSARGGAAGAHFPRPGAAASGRWRSVADQLLRSSDGASDSASLIAGGGGAGEDGGDGSGGEIPCNLLISPPAILSARRRRRSGGGRGSGRSGRSSVSSSDSVRLVEVSGGGSGAMVAAFPRGHLSFYSSATHAAGGGVFRTERVAAIAREERDEELQAAFDVTGAAALAGGEMLVVVSSGFRCFGTLTRLAEGEDCSVSGEGALGAPAGDGGTAPAASAAVLRFSKPIAAGALTCVAAAAESFVAMGAEDGQVRILRRCPFSYNLVRVTTLRCEELGGDARILQLAMAASGRAGGEAGGASAGEAGAGASRAAGAASGAAGGASRSGVGSFGGSASLASSRSSASTASSAGGGSAVGSASGSAPPPFRLTITAATNGPAVPIWEIAPDAAGGAAGSFALLTPEPMCSVALAGAHVVAGSVAGSLYIWDPARNPAVPTVRATNLGGKVRWIVAPGDPHSAAAPRFCVFGVAAAAQQLRGRQRIGCLDFFV